MLLTYKYQRLISPGFRLRNKSSISRKSVAKPGLPPRGSATQQCGGGEPHSPLVGPDLPPTSSTCHTQTASTGPQQRHGTRHCKRSDGKLVTMTHFVRAARLPSAMPRQPSSVWQQQRKLHLAPPFLLDSYVPRYQTLGARDAALKRSRAYAHLRNCNLCPRLCGVNRYETTGMCLVGEKAKVNVIAPHFGEGRLGIVSYCQWSPTQS